MSGFKVKLKGSRRRDRGGIKTRDTDTQTQRHQTPKPLFRPSTTWILRCRPKAFPPLFEPIPQRFPPQSQRPLEFGLRDRTQGCSFDVCRLFKTGEARLPTLKTFVLFCVSSPGAVHCSSMCRLCFFSGCLRAMPLLSFIHFTPPTPNTHFFRVSTLY